MRAAGWQRACVLCVLWAPRCVSSNRVLVLCSCTLRSFDCPCCSFCYLGTAVCVCSSSRSENSTRSSPTLVSVNEPSFYVKTVWYRRWRWRRQPNAMLRRQPRYGSQQPVQNQVFNSGLVADASARCNEKTDVFHRHGRRPAGGETQRGRQRPRRGWLLLRVAVKRAQTDPSHASVPAWIKNTLRGSLRWRLEGIRSEQKLGAHDPRRTFILWRMLHVCEDPYRPQHRE